MDKRQQLLDEAQRLRRQADLLQKEAEFEDHAGLFRWLEGTTWTWDGTENPVLVEDPHGAFMDAMHRSTGSWHGNVETVLEGRAVEFNCNDSRIDLFLDFSEEATSEQWESWKKVHPEERSADSNDAHSSEFTRLCGEGLLKVAKAGGFKVIPQSMEEEALEHERQAKRIRKRFLDLYAALCMSETDTPEVK